MLDLDYLEMTKRIINKIKKKIKFFIIKYFRNKFIMTS